MDKEIQELLTRGVENIIVSEDLEKKLKSGKRLRVKHGVDPTTADLHLGYAVIYEKLRKFQELGHTIAFLIGGFTGRFGDPTDKNETRKMRDKAEVDKFAKSYLAQLGKILDLKKIELHNNADWYDKMSAEDMLRIMSEFSVAQMLERDMFQKRISDAKRIGLHEIVYPVLQGYDSVELKSDLTVIGTDQIFNELQARVVQENRGMLLQDLIAMRILVGLDGKRKMSQSFGNCIGFNDEPSDMYGKVMSISDECIFDYFELVTRVSLPEIAELKAEMVGGKNPRDYKMRLAREIVTIYHDAKKAKAAEVAFVSQFQKKKVPDDIPQIKLTGQHKVVDIMVEQKMCSSKNEAKRLIGGGGVKIDSEKVSDIDTVLPKKDCVLKVGKRKFLKIKF